MKRAGAPVLAAALAAGLAAPAPPARAADPFDERLAAEGAAAAARGDWAAATRDLSRAAFGLLDEPPALAAVLVRLALAQASAGDREAFAATFRRVAEIEDRFGAYRAADLPADQRRAFETEATAAIPPAELERTAAFRSLALARRAAELARLPPRERRARLEALAAAAPAEPRWALALAELELAEGKPARAAELAGAVLAAAPADEEARCLRGTARARSGACADAVADLAACPRARREAAPAEALLACLVDDGRWDEARRLAGELAPALREARPIARLLKRVERRAGAGGEADGADDDAPATAAAPPADPGAAPDPSAAAASPPAAAPALAAADQETLRRVRAALAEARTVRDLDEALRQATDVAERNPGDADAQHLAGEVAYRASRWPEASRFFRRGGEPGAERSELLFYMAVTYYETGDLAAARTALSKALPGLKRTPFVEGYVGRILGPTP
jgi:hypothetical protein